MELLAITNDSPAMVIEYRKQIIINEKEKDVRHNLPRQVENILKNNPTIKEVCIELESYYMDNIPDTIHRICNIQTVTTLWMRVLVAPVISSLANCMHLRKLCIAGIRSNIDVDMSIVFKLNIESLSIYGLKTNETKIDKLIEAIKNNNKITSFRYTSSYVDNNNMYYQQTLQTICEYLPLKKLVLHGIIFVNNESYLDLLLTITLRKSIRVLHFVSSNSSIIRLLIRRPGGSEKYERFINNIASSNIINLNILHMPLTEVQVQKILTCSSLKYLCMDYYYKLQYNFTDLLLQNYNVIYVINYCVIGLDHIYDKLRKHTNKIKYNMEKRKSSLFDDLLDIDE